MEMYEGWWQAMGMYGLKKKSTTNETLSQFVHTIAEKLSSYRGGSRGRVQGVRTPPFPEMTCGFLIQLVFCKKKKICGLLVLK